MPLTQRYSDTHVLVTGGASGIGAATVLRVADEGARVTVTDLEEGRAKDVAEVVDGLGLGVDVTDTDGVFAAVAAAVEAHGPVDVLVCCAGGDRPALFEDTYEADWNRAIAVNLRGVMAGTAAVLPSMLARRKGSIVAVSSEAGRIGMIAGAAYAAAKAGVIGFTKAIAREGAAAGVRCNAVAPGPIDTPMLEELATTPLGKALRSGMVEATALGRAGRPEEVAATIAFLGSDDASFITGDTVAVSGGLSMW